MHHAKRFIKYRERAAMANGITVTPSKLPPLKAGRSPADARPELACCGTLTSDAVQGNVGDVAATLHRRRPRRWPTLVSTCVVTDVNVRDAAA